MNQRQLYYRDYIFSTAVTMNGKTYFFSEKENMFMEIDMITWKLKYSSVFPKNELYYCSRAHALRTVHGKIFKLTLDGKYIEKFSLEDKQYRRIELDNYERKWGNFVAFEIEGNYLYVFPKRKQEIIKIDTITYKKEIICIPYLSSTNILEKKMIDFSMACRREGDVWLYETQSQQIVVYDMQSNTFTFYVMPGEIKDCIAACWDGDLFYLLTSDNYIYMWNPYSGFSRIIWKGRYYNARYFGKIIMIQQKLFLLPCMGENIVIVDSESGEDLIYTGYPEDFIYYDLRWNKYSENFEDDEYIYFPMRVSNYMMTINKKNGDIMWHSILMPSIEERIEFYLENLLTFQDDLKVLVYSFKNSKKKYLQFRRRGEFIWEKAK